MDVFTTLEILILVALTGAFLQLSPGIFMLFYHYALGKKSKKTVDDLSLFYIAGVEAVILIFFLITYYSVNLSYLYFPNIVTGLPVYIMAGVLIALALFCIFFYFRKGPSLSLFISRKLAKSLDSLTRTVDSRKKAFTLGIASTIPELFLTLPLYIIASVQLMKYENPVLPRPVLILVLLIISLLGLLFIRLLFRTNHNLAEIDRLRRKNKNFLRFMLAFLYLIIALLIIIPELNHGI